MNEPKTKTGPLSQRREEPSYMDLSSQSYHELDDIPRQDADLLFRIQSQLQLLEDLSGRHAFLMREVRYLLKV